jgi:P4 family phage/plasmid primase-like protien
VKLLTGGDKITGRFMRQDFFDFTPAHTLFLMGNHQPQVSAGGKSFWRRLRLIPFQHEVPENLRNENLARELVDNEGPAILAWIVTGAVAMLRDGLAEPASVMAATHEYAESEDHIGQFLTECTTKVSNTFKLPAGDVYRRYVDWCRDNGISPKENNWFSRDLSAKGFRLHRSNGKRFVFGIMLDIPASPDPRNPG